MKAGARQRYQARRIRHCGEWLRFRDYYTISQHKLTAGNFCDKPLICGLCAILRGSRLLASYLARFQLVRAVGLACGLS